MGSSLQASSGVSEGIESWLGLIGGGGRRKHVLLEIKNKTLQGVVVLCTHPEGLAQIHTLA